MKLRQAKKNLQHYHWPTHWPRLPKHWHGRVYFRAYLKVHEGAIKATNNIPKIPGLPVMFWNYDLKTGLPKASTLFEHTWFQDYLGYRVLKAYQIANELLVSTVNLGVNLNFLNPQQPLIFETMVFGGEMDSKQWRYSTRDEALKSHDDIVTMVKHSLEQDKAGIDNLIREVENG